MIGAEAAERMVDVASDVSSVRVSGAGEHSNSAKGQRDGGELTAGMVLELTCSCVAPGMPSTRSSLASSPSCLALLSSLVALCARLDLAAVTRLE